MIVRLKLVDDTMGASYNHRKINFNPENLAWWQEITNRRAYGNDKYPDVIEFCFKGSDLIFRARLNEFFEATK